MTEKTLEERSIVQGQDIPERDLRCIFEDILVGDDLGAAMAAGFVEEAADGVDISTVICSDSSRRLR
jgi:hypothetical protein